MSRKDTCNQQICRNRRYLAGTLGLPGWDKPFPRTAGPETPDKAARLRENRDRIVGSMWFSTCNRIRHRKTPSLGALIRVWESALLSRDELGNCVAPSCKQFPSCIITDVWSLRTLASAELVSSYDKRRTRVSLRSLTVEGWPRRHLDPAKHQLIANRHI